jgi:hypothetical protein
MGPLVCTIVLSVLKNVMFVSDVSQVQVGTSHQDQRVVGYLTSTHLHAIEGTFQTISLSFSLTLALTPAFSLAQGHSGSPR